MFVRSANPIWYLPDLIGQPLNDQYYAFFLTNTMPYLPQNVYQDPQGLTVWPGDIVQFLPNGTLPDNLYFDPDLVYRIEIRMGNLQTDPLIYEINNYVPTGGGGGGGGGISSGFGTNQADNPNFAEVSFTPTSTSAGLASLTITMAGTYSIAPGWFLDLTGAGTITLTQLIIPANQNQVNDPPFALQISSTGWTSVILRQRFNHNGGIWTGGAISMSLTATAINVPELITLSYVPNVPGLAVQVAQELVNTGNYQVVQGAVNLPLSVNNAPSPIAYVDMEIILPPTGIVDITAFQVVGQSAQLLVSPALPANIPPYQQQSEERGIDQLFHIYRDELLQRSLGSLLVGWNFPLNPFQFTTTTVTPIVPQTSYVADQTILYQPAASQIQTGANPNASERFNFFVQAVAGATTTQFALIQYIDPTTILPYWSYILSSLARVRIFTSHNTQVRLKARLIWRTTLPPTLTAFEPIASLTVGLDPTFAAGWTPIIPLNDPAYILPNAYENGNTTLPYASYPAFNFEQFQLPDASTDTMTLAIVLYTLDNMNSTATTQDSIAFDKVSLIPSSFAADAAPQTFDESLRECQFYYEKSYGAGVLPGSITASGCKQNIQNYFLPGASLMAKPGIFELQYDTVKRAPAVITTYSPTAVTAGLVLINNWSNGASVGIANVALAGNWNAAAFNEDGTIYEPASNTTLLTSGGAPISPQVEMLYQYTADARMGV